MRGRSGGFGGRQPPKGLVRARSGEFSARWGTRGRWGSEGWKGRSSRSRVFKGLGGSDGRRAEVAEVVFSGGWGNQKAEGQK